MRTCFCAALAELTVLSDDPREETRLRRTLFGIEIQRWRLASTIVLPDGSSNGSPACDVETMSSSCSPPRRRAHDHA